MNVDDEERIRIKRMLFGVHTKGVPELNGTTKITIRDKVSGDMLALYYSQEGFEYATIQEMRYFKDVETRFE